MDVDPHRHGAGAAENGGPGPGTESAGRSANDTETASGNAGNGGHEDAVAPEGTVPLLESTGEFSCPHCDSKIRLEAVGLRFAGASDAETVQLDLRHPEEPLDVVVDDVRRVLAIRALREANGVKVRAAGIAGMKYTTFYELVRRLGITDDDIGL